MMTRRAWNFLDLTEQRYGRLVVLARAANRRSVAHWLCQCDCGTVKVVRSNALRSGNTKSCGCLDREKSAARWRTHGKRSSPAYSVWAGMFQRCYNQNRRSFKHYGGRGITVCRRWFDFENFLADMGEKPKGLTLDRYPDNDGPYAPENCRWATYKQQAQNKRGKK